MYVMDDMKIILNKDVLSEKSLFYHKWFSNKE